MGRLIDSLSFNLPQQQVISSDPSKAPGAEFTQTYLAKGQQQSKRIEQFRGLVGSVADAGFKVLGPMIKEEREAKTRAGAVYGMKAAQELNLSGDYKQVSQQIRDNFTVLRRNGEISLIDDPYFQAGLDKAQGITAINQYNQAAATLYEKLSSAPDFYENPDKFETEWRRLFDSFYVTIPESTIYQEAFLSKVGPIQDKYLQAYKAATNEHYRKKFVSKQQESILASEFTFQQTIDGFDSLSDTDILEQYTNFANSLVDGFTTGEITTEEIKEYLGTDVTDEQDLIYQLQKTLESDDPGEAMRAKLKAFAKVDLIKDINEVYDEFYSFAGEGRGALGIDPSDLIVTTLTKGFDDPGLAIEVLSNLRSGTGLLKDTEKGKAGLSILQENHVKFAENQRDKELREYRLERQEFGKSAAMEIGEIQSKIASFADLLAIQQTKGEPMSPTELYESIKADIYSLYTDPQTGELIDPEAVADLMSSLSTQRNRAMSLSDSAQRRLEFESTFNEVMGINQEGGDVEDKTAAESALALVQLSRINGEQTRDLIDSRTGTLHSEYLNNPEDEEAQTAFWNHVRTLKNYNAMNAGSSDVRVSPSYSSKDLLVQNPGLIQTMIIADANYDALDVFVNPNSEIYDAIQEIGQPYLELGGDPANLGVVLTQQLDKFEADRLKEEQKQAEKARIQALKDRLGFDPESIPLPGATPGTIRNGGSRDLMMNIKGIGSFGENEYPVEDRALFVNAYAESFNKYIDQGYSRGMAAMKAVKDFGERFEVYQIGDDLKMIIDNTQQVENLPIQTYFEQLEGDEDNRQAHILGFVEDLKFMTNNRSSATATAWLADFRSKTKRRVVAEQLALFDQQYESQYLTNRQDVPISNIDAFFEDLRSNDQIDGRVAKAIENGVRNWLQLNNLEGTNQNMAALNEGTFNSMSKMILESIQSDTEYVGDKPSTITEVRELIHRLDLNNRFDAKVLDPRYKEQLRTITKNSLTQELTEEGGLEGLLVSRYGEQVARAFTEQDLFIAQTAVFDLDDTGFDWDSEDYKLLPTSNGRFYIKDKEGNTLRYKNGGNVFTFSPEDLGDRMIDGGLFTYAGVWKDVGPIIDPDIGVEEMTSKERFYDAVAPYFQEWPSNLNITYFNVRFGEHAYPMYKVYREIKGMPAFEKDIPPGFFDKINTGINMFRAFNRMGR